MRRRLPKLLLLLAAPWLTYVVVANLFVMTPLLTWLTNRNPTKFTMSYGFVCTWWPGEVYVRDFRLTFAAYQVAFELEIDEARADIQLTELLHRRFHARDVKAGGVSWQLAQRGEPARWGTLREAAFPHLTGVIPFQVGPRPEPFSRRKHRAWSVRLDRVDARVRELWVLEYRWRGNGRARGDFEVRPFNSFWVGPAELQLDPGTLFVGEKQVAANLSGDAVTVVTPTAIPYAERLRMLRGLNVEARFHMNVDDLSFAKVYGFDASGHGDLELEAHVHGGRVAEGTAVKLDLPRAKWAHANGAGFVGSLAARFEPGARPVVRATGSGDLVLPGALTAHVPELNGTVRLTTNDLAQGPRLASFGAEAEQLEIADGAGVKAALKGRVPFFVPVLLGDGQLTARGVEVRGTPKKVELKVEGASMGATTARGEVELVHGRASGAVEAHVRMMGIGIELEQGKPKLHFLTKRGWLEKHLAERRGRAAPARPPAAHSR